MSRICQVEPEVGGRGPEPGPVKMWEVGLKGLEVGFGVEVEEGEEEGESSESRSRLTGVDSVAVAAAAAEASLLLVSWMVMVW